MPILLKIKSGIQRRGEYDIFSKKSIFNIFRLFDKKEIVVANELFYESKNIHIEEMCEIEFINSIDNRNVYLYSLDKEILFSIDWERFFFLIATNEAFMNRIISTALFEGFLCDNQTKDTWEFSNEEISELLDKETGS